MSRGTQPWVFTYCLWWRALLGFCSSWHSADRSDNERNSCIESSADGRNYAFRLLVFDCARTGALNSQTGGENVTWLLVVLIAASAAVLIAHAIDAMRSR